jgi:serine/threonine protein kinase
MLRRNQVVRDPVTEWTYTVVGTLGQGAFGSAYLADAADASGELVGPVALKVTDDRATWIHESYMGLLVRGEPRVVENYFSFAFSIGSGRRRRVLYALVSDWMPDGTVADFLTHGTWNPTDVWVRRELKALLRLLAKLHATGAVHGDIHRENVFLDGRKLILGDFGLARHFLPGRSLRGRSVFADGGSSGTNVDDPYAWTPRGDLLGLAVVLVAARTGDWTDAELIDDTIATSGMASDLQAFMNRMVAEREADAFPDAGAALAALNPERNPWAPPPKSLRGLNVVITGTLEGMTQGEATERILQAGGTVQDRVRRNTNAIVVGQPSRYYRVTARHGTKLRDAARAVAQGQRIAMIGTVDLKRLTRAKRRAEIGTRRRLPLK